MENQLYWHCKTINQLEEIGKNILFHCTSQKIAFSGEIGAGKTSMIKVLCKLLGYNK